MYSARVIRKGFRRTYDNVKGDLIMTDDRPSGSSTPLPVRVLILGDDSRVELPMNDTVIVFSRERFLDIKGKMEAETGAAVKTP